MRTNIVPTMSGAISIDVICPEIRQLYRNVTLALDNEASGMFFDTWNKNRKREGGLEPDRMISVAFNNTDILLLILILRITSPAFDNWIRPGHIKALTIG